MILHTALELAAPLSGIIPDPQPTAPPGSEGLSDVINWISWGCLFASLAGFLISAGSLAVAHYTGRPVNSFKGMGYALLAAVLTGAAGLIMRTFT